jgi:hypothetical protein
MTHVKPSELAVKIASTGMNSCPGIIRSDSSVPSGHIDDIGGKSGICRQSGFSISTFDEMGQERLASNKIGEALTWIRNVTHF